MLWHLHVCNACHQSKMATLCLVHGFRVDERFVWFSRYDISVLCWIMYFYNLCVWCLFWQHYSWFLLLFCPLFSFLSCMNQFWISSERIQLWERHILYLWVYWWLSNLFYQKLWISRIYAVTRYMIYYDDSSALWLFMCLLFTLAYLLARYEIPPLIPFSMNWNIIINVSHEFQFDISHF